MDAHGVTPEGLVSETTDLVSLPDIYIRLKAVVDDPESSMADVADGNDGAIIRLNGGYRIPIDQTWNLSLGAFTTWADDDYMQAYFEIDAADAARSGLQTFDADSGFKDLGLNLTASFKPWEHWGLMGLVSYKRLLNDAEDSPVVDDEGDENQFVGGILVIYNF